MSILENGMPGGQAPAEPLLEVRDLCMRFGKGKNAVDVLRKVSFSINAGETYGLVGESGSGKSTIGKCVIGLYEPTGGTVRFDGQEIAGAEAGKGRTAGINPGIQMIFQNPMSSLNPRKSVREIVGAGLDLRHLCRTPEEREQRILEYLKKTGLSAAQADRYPSQFSGGQRQRVSIARALAMEPKLIIADECIAALDASIQAQVVNLLRRLQRETGTAFLFISHDLSMVRYLAQRIGVLHLGYLLETGSSEELFRNPVHPYTRNLFSAIPRPNPIVQREGGGGYDYATSGILYEQGSWHPVNEDGSHRVWCTDEEWKKWSGNGGRRAG